MLGVTATYNHAVPLRLHREKIMVEITGPCTEKGRTAHLDLVVVLDTSSSMSRGHKLHDMKQAAEFVIRKMGEGDRLTIVPFSSEARTPSATAYMSPTAKQHASSFVRALRADGNTNIKDGIDAAVRILRGRRDKIGRAAGVFLMSDGRQHIGNAREVHVRDLPVFTFGFGKDHDHQLLYDIAHESHGGTYHNTPHSSDCNKLLRYFAKVLGILRDVSVLNLAVTLSPHAGATILEVRPGNHRVTTGHHGSSTIHFGELARKEQRKIIVAIQLPEVHHSERAKVVMAVECSYRLPREREITSSLRIAMARDRGIARLPAPSDHFQVELARRDQAHRIRRAKSLADANRFADAKREVAEMKDALGLIQSTQNTVRLLQALLLELQHIESLLASQEDYNQCGGGAYMLAAMLSHGRQRFGARGGAREVMLYQGLPRMDKYATQSGHFHKNPNAHI